MPHSIHRVTSVEVIGPYEVRLGFEDGKTQEIDPKPILKGEIYGPLRDPELLARVRVDPEVQKLIGPDGAEFDPAILHDWPEYAQPMQDLASGWTLVGAEIL